MRLKEQLFFDDKSKEFNKRVEQIMTEFKDVLFRRKSFLDGVGTKIKKENMIFYEVDSFLNYLKEKEPADFFRLILDKIGNYLSELKETGGEYADIDQAIQAYKNFIRNNKDIFSGFNTIDFA